MKGNVGGYGWQAVALLPFDLDILRVRLDNAQRITHSDARGIAVAGVEQSLHWGLTARVNVFGKLRRHHDGHRAGAMVNLVNNVVIAAGHMNDGEIISGLEMLEQILTELCSVLVVHAERNVLDVQIYAVTIDDQLHNRHGKDDQQAEWIAPDLDDFLTHHGKDSAQTHAVLPRLDSRAAVRLTNTSSRLG